MFSDFWNSCFFSSIFLCTISFLNPLQCTIAMFTCSCTKLSVQLDIGQNILRNFQLIFKSFKSEFVFAPYTCIWYSWSCTCIWHCSVLLLLLFSLQVVGYNKNVQLSSLCIQMSSPCQHNQSSTINSSFKYFENLHVHVCSWIHFWFSKNKITVFGLRTVQKFLGKVSKIATSYMCIVCLSVSSKWNCTWGLIHVYSLY